MIVARLMVVTSASFMTVHIQRWNCHLRIKADVDFAEVTMFAFVFNFNMGLHFFVYMHWNQYVLKLCHRGLFINPNQRSATVAELTYIK
jgi:hypothetical protein